MTLETIKNQIRAGKYPLPQLRYDLAKIYGLSKLPYESIVWLMAENASGERGVFVLIDKYQELFNMIELIKAVKSEKS
jgi:hypothetical protein